MMASKMMASGGTIEISIATSVYRPDIVALANAAGWNGNGPIVVNISAPLINTLDLGDVPFQGGITVNISAGTRIGGVRGGSSSVGTYGLRTRVPVTVNNLGVISGGGGGGGNGGMSWVRYQTTSETNTGSGGAGGSGQGFQAAGSLAVADNTNGGGGSTSTYSGAVLGGQTRPWATGGTGGTGGTWGASGAYGGIGSINGSYAESYQAPQPVGAAAGPAVDGNANITWQATGTRQGALI